MASLLLRIALLTTALGWGMGALALVMADAQVWPWLNSLAGGADVPRHPAFAYWIRMLACCCGLVAALAVWTAADLGRQRALAWVLTAFQVATGLALCLWGLRLEVGVAMWGIDVGFCLGTALAQIIGLVLTRRAAATQADTV